MSLLDDVSIVVTPNGYKAGELYAVVPVPTEGAEILSQPVDLVTDFIAVNGASIVDVNTFTTTGGSVEGMTKASIFTVGKRYKLIIEGTTTSSVFSLGNTTAGGNEYGTGFGTHIFTASGNTTLWIRQSTAGTTDITSFTIKEYTAADMDVTRATAATRVDENGLVNYAEVLGGEEITNGDFATNLDSWSTSSWWVWNALGAYHPSTSSHKPLYQQCCVIGKTYLITFDLNCVGSSQAKFSLGSSTGSTTQVIGTSLTTGSYSYFVTAAAEYIVFNRQNTAEYYVNNVSVKEAARDNVPRIDYTGGGCPHILAEPQRTNLVTYSESFGSGKYFDTYNEANEVSSNNTSPSGIENATQIISTGQGKLYAFISLPANTTYSFSFYAKNVDATEVKSRILATGGSGGSNLTPVSYISQLSTTEWTKITHIFTTNSTAVQYYVFISHALSIGGNIQIWGAQLELGSYSTSLIPTSGSTVTRNQDQFTRDGIVV